MAELIEPPWIRSTLALWIQAERGVNDDDITLLHDQIIFTYLISYHYCTLKYCNEKCGVFRELSCLLREYA